MRTLVRDFTGIFRARLLASRLPAALLGGLFVTALALPANATVIINSDTSVTVSQAGDSFAVNYACTTDCGGEGQPLYEMTAMTTWTVDSISADKIVFEIEIMNSTDDQFGDTNRVTRFGAKDLDPDLDREPDGAAVDNSGSTISLDWDADVHVTFPTFNKVDLIIYEDDSGNAGLKSGQTDTLLVTLMVEDANRSFLDGLTLNIFPIKFQALSGTISGADSWEFGGTVKLKQAPGDQVAIPEPSTLGLFGFGLAGLGLLARRRRKA